MKLRKGLYTVVTVRPVFWIWALLCLGACKKEDMEQPGAGGNNAPKAKLVRSIEFDNGSIKTMHYNPDSTLQKIAYRYGAVESATIFNWEDHHLKEMFEEELSFKNVFYYNGAGIARYVHTNNSTEFPSSYTMEYSYDGQGRVRALKYYTTGNILQATSTYHYTNGALERVVTKDADNVYTHIIEAYSDTAWFDPLLFIETALPENYPVFNIPVLGSIKKLPAKIVRMVQMGDNDPYIDIIEEHTVVITDKHIAQITNNITVPLMPGYRKRVVGMFKY